MSAALIATPPLDNVAYFATTQNMEPATTIISRLGGPSKVAAITGVHRTRVSNWMRPKSVGGTGGNIPQAHQLTILKAAKEAGIEDITGESFLPRENAGAAA